MFKRIFVVISCVLFSVVLLSELKANEKKLTAKEVVQILKNKKGVLVNNDGTKMEPHSSEARSLIQILREMNLRMCLSSAKYCLDCNGSGAPSSIQCGKMCKCPDSCQETSPESACGLSDPGTVLVFEP